MVMTPQQQKDYTARIVKAAMFEWAMLLVGLYFLFSYTSPGMLTELGLPVVVQGVGNVVIFILAVAVGATPLIRVVLSGKNLKS